MKKYNIIEDRPDLTSEEIKNGMDFSKVINKTVVKSSGTIYKKKSVGIGGFIILASIVFLVNKNNVNSNQKRQDATLLADSMKMQEFVLESQSDTTLVYSSSSLISIPSNAFVDSAGNEIKGKIQLRFEEYHNVGEILLSGIPMTYDSAGIKYNFESAGMFKIEAEQSGNPIFIKSGKSIEIKMASLNNDKSKFNKYYFDKKKNAWDYLEKDIPSQLNSISTSEIPESKFDLIKPKEKNSKAIQFTINVSFDEFPELKAFNNLLFEISPKNKNFDSKTANITWDEVEIERIENTDDYNVTFTNDNKTFSVIAYPVVNTSDLKTSKQYWESQYAKYKNAVSIKTKEDENKQNKLNNEISFWKVVQNYYNKLKARNTQISSDVGATDQVIYRTFQVQKFGIWNSDCPQNLPQQAIVDAQYTTEDGKPISVAKVYLVEAGNNALYSLSSGDKVYFNPSVENTLIVITEDNYLGYFTVDQFKDLNKSTKEYTFKLKMKKKEKYTTNDINSLI